ncbi:7570_t:CDS:1 [Ambispora leptoticha]|uniref:7570_t:CDS:1 n=1 Tax=Ambispora leptoticha TaxID=144679 RepID=A0A9N9CIT4_9GLOM|nr:7570_t:CDS:1 [Ambispora leptoticha]
MPKNSQNSVNITSIINMLSRDRLFPPYYKDPKDFIQSQRGERPKRPQNAFFIFRRNVSNELRRVGITTCNMRQTSTISGYLWRDASEEQKSAYEEVAKQVRILHHRMFPDYVYTKPRAKLEFRIHVHKPKTRSKNNSHSEIRDNFTYRNPDISATSSNRSLAIAPTVPSNAQ